MIIKCSQINIRCLTFLLCFASIVVQSVTLEQQRELIYTKALIAYNDNHFEEALKLLEKNITQDSFHPPSISLLAKIHKEKSQYLKVLKIFYNLVGIYHKKIGKKILANNDLTKVENIIKNSVRPNEEILDFYYQISTVYNLLAKKRQEKRPKYAKKLFDLEKKYRLVCQWYDYKAPEMAIEIGLLEQSRGKDLEAVQHLINAKKLLREQSAKDKRLKDKYSQLSNTVDFYLARSLINEGHTEVAKRYFKNLYNSNHTNKSLKKLSKQYLSGLSLDFWMLSFSFDVGHDSNANQLSRKQLTNFNEVQDDTGKKSGSYNTKAATFFYNSKQRSQLSFSITGGFNEQTFFDELLAHNDYRNFFLSPELKYSYSPTSIFKLNFYGGYDYSKDATSNGSNFSHTSTTTTMTPSYETFYNRGVISISGIYTSSTTLEDSSVNKEIGGSIEYIPFPFSQFLAPNFLFQLDRATTDSTNEIVNTFTSSISNQSSIDTDHNIYSTLEFSKSSSTISGESEEEYHANLLYIYELKFLAGLSNKFSYDFYFTRLGVGLSDSRRKHVIATGLSYSF
jgi:hypothetical protein